MIIYFIILHNVTATPIIIPWNSLGVIGTWAGAISSAALAALLLWQTQKTNNQMIELEKSISKSQSELNISLSEKQMSMQKELFIEQRKIEQDIAEREFKAKEFELKIHLYYIRVNIYEKFTKLFGAADLFSKGDPMYADLPSGIGRTDKKTMVRQILFNQHEDLKRQEDVKKFNEGNEEIRKELNAKMFMEDLQKFSVYSKDINSAKFCYPEEISNIAIEWTNELSNVLFTNELPTKLIKLTKEIDDRKIVENMEKYLLIIIEEMNKKEKDNIIYL